MTDDLFDLVFSGEIVSGQDLAVVKKNFAALFKLSPEKVDALFSGKTITLKKNLSFDAAKRYRVAIKNAGGKVVLRRTGEAVPPKAKAESPVSKPESSNKPEQVPVAAEEEAPPPMPMVEEASEEEAEQFVAAQAKKPAPIITDEPVKQTAALSLAAAGSDVLSPSERSEQAPVAVDTSSLSLRQGGGRLVDEGENQAVEAVDVSIPNVELSEVGEDLLHADEKRDYEELNLDLGHMSIAEVGARLGQEDDSPPPPAPSTDHLSVAD